MKAVESRILITGATGGIGRHAASAFLAAGARVLLSARQPQALSDFAVALRRRHPEAAADLPWVAADLRQPQDLKRLADNAASWGCNVVVHAAGAPAFGPLEAQDPLRIAGALQANLVAPMLLTRALLPHLKRQARAQVLCVGSVLGAIGLPGYSVYSASKFGLRGFAQALRRELAATSVRVQYLGPRSTRTAFNDADVLAYNRATQTASDAPERVAAALLQMLQDESAERFLGFPEKLGVRINGAWPTVLDGSFERHARSLLSLPSLTQRTEP